MTQKSKTQAGFTLIELLVAMGITAVVLMAVFATHSTQQKSQLVQDQVVEMQQNIRAGMLVLARDIREAGCDPKLVSGAGFVTAKAGQLRITRDTAGNAIDANRGDGTVSSPGEDIIFGFDPNSVDANADGVPDTAGAAADLCRNDVIGVNAFQPIAQNIERVEFNYLDEDGETIAFPINSQPELNRIRAVQVSLLVRSAYPDPKYTNSATYTTAAGNAWGPFNDNFRRRLIVTVIQCRNMGLDI